MVGSSKVLSSIRDRVQSAPPGYVWTPNDFTDLGTRQAIDTALHRLPASNDMRHIARGLYDVPNTNNLTRKSTTPNPRYVIDAIGRRGKVRVLVDGITAANDLGLTDAVPARVTVLTDGRLQPIQISNLTIEFQHTSPSRLYWAGRPAMRFVQALHWLRDMIASDDGTIRRRLRKVLNDPQSGNAIQDDLQHNWHALPDWMRVIVRDLLKGGDLPKKQPSVATQEASLK